jgi:GNAT superfamily N-acetyltransferase
MSRVDPMITKPAFCSKVDLQEFCKLVRQGDEVEAQGLEARVKRAKALVFLRVDGELVGVAALKEPAQTYRDGVFRKAVVPGASTVFWFELGWVFVSPAHRRKGYSRVLSGAAISQSDREPLFATTRLDNVAMQKVLEDLGLRRLGESWQSDRGAKPWLVLYVTT